jgi:hypothetical protein
MLKNGKNILFVLVCMTIALTPAGFFSSCSMDNDRFLNETGNRVDDEDVLYFKAENASELSNVAEVILMGYDRSIYDDENRYEYVELARGNWKDGGCTIALPKTVGTNYLRTFTHTGWMPQSVFNASPTITNSNKNVKIGDVEFWGVDKDGYKVTEFFPATINEDGKDRSAFFMYANSDAVISGHADGVITIQNEGGPQIMKITTIYSIEWKKGWNAWIRSDFVSVPDGTMKEELSSTTFGSLKWYGRIRVDNPKL